MSYLPREADLEKVSSSLNDGLKTCRTMVADYRLMLGGQRDDGAPADQRGPEIPGVDTHDK